MSQFLFQSLLSLFLFSAKNLFAGRPRFVEIRALSFARLAAQRLSAKFTYSLAASMTQRGICAQERYAGKKDARLQAARAPFLRALSGAYSGSSELVRSAGLGGSSRRRRAPSFHPLAREFVPPQVPSALWRRTRRGRTRALPDPSIYSRNASGSRRI